jgi:hypothetical protein
VQRAGGPAALDNRIGIDPLFVEISRTKTGLLDPRVRSGSLALQLAAPVPNDGFFTPTSYVGAFSTIGNWAYGRTKLGRDGYFSRASAVEGGDTVVINRGSTTRLINIATRTMLAAGGTAFPGFVLGGTQVQTRDDSCREARPRAVATLNR